MKVFGPVPSRRLGQSLGINNIPPKFCTYSCIYCQIGRADKLYNKRQVFYKPDELAEEVRLKVEETKKKGIIVDYLSFVPDGEPTIDINLGRNIDLVRPLGINIAVITNGTLLSLKDVREELARADLISLKVDAVSSKIWRKIDRPHYSFDLQTILEGILEFGAMFRGEIITETMFIKGLNDSPDEIEGISDFLTLLKPARSYISIPTRPTAEKWALPADHGVLNMAYQIFQEKLSNVEFLIGYEGNEFGVGENTVEGLLDITSVHPMREEAVREYLNKSGAEWSLVTDLIKKGLLAELEYRGKLFYIRKFSQRA